ncbi:hypothetical protein L345_11919, partial [Ophiophagus hannah]
MPFLNICLYPGSNSQPPDYEARAPPLGHRTTHIIPCQWSKKENSWKVTVPQAKLSFVSPVFFFGTWQRWGADFHILNRTCNEQKKDRVPVNTPDGIKTPRQAYSSSKTHVRHIVQSGCSPNPSWLRSTLLPTPGRAALAPTGKNVILATHPQLSLPPATLPFPQLQPALLPNRPCCGSPEDAPKMASGLTDCPPQLRRTSCKKKSNGGASLKSFSSHGWSPLMLRWVSGLPGLPVLAESLRPALTDGYETLDALSLTRMGTFQSKRRLQEREDRIKNHLTLAASGKSLGWAVLGLTTIGLATVQMICQLGLPHTAISASLLLSCEQKLGCLATRIDRFEVTTALKNGLMAVFRRDNHCSVPMTIMSSKFRWSCDQAKPMGKPDSFNKQVTNLSSAVIPLTTLARKMGHLTNVLLSDTNFGLGCGLEGYLYLMLEVGEGRQVACLRAEFLFFMNEGKYTSSSFNDPTIPCRVESGQLNGAECLLAGCPSCHQVFVLRAFGLVLEPIFRETSCKVALIYLHLIKSLGAQTLEATANDLIAGHQDSNHQLKSHAQPGTKERRSLRTGSSMSLKARKTKPLTFAENPLKDLQLEASKPPPKKRPWEDTSPLVPCTLVPFISNKGLVWFFSCLLLQAKNLKEAPRLTTARYKLPFSNPACRSFSDRLKLQRHWKKGHDRGSRLGPLGHAGVGFSRFGPVQAKTLALISQLRTGSLRRSCGPARPCAVLTYTCSGDLHGRADYHASAVLLPRSNIEAANRLSAPVTASHHWSRCHAILSLRPSNKQSHWEARFTSQPAVVERGSARLTMATTCICEPPLKPEDTLAPSDPCLEEELEPELSNGDGTSPMTPLESPGAEDNAVPSASGIGGVDTGGSGIQ